MDRHVRRRLALSTAVVVAAAVGLAGAPAQADPTTGSIIGQVVTDTGARAAGVRLTAVGNSFGSGVTDADGNYRLDNLAPGDYRLRVEPRAGMSQYANQKRFYFQADVFAVRAGESTSVNETLLPRGAMRGRLVDTDGSPLGGVQVAISYLDGSAFLDTSTDADGRWLFEDIFAGRYQVKFDDYGRGIHQSAFGRTGIAKPDPVTVIAGQAAEVNDTAVARTSMRITATDSLSGAQVMSFSAFAAGSFASSDTGELLLSPVQAGTHRVDVFADGYLGAFNDISLVPGEIAQLAVRLVPQSSIEATVVDAQTGQPVPGICVDAYQLTLAVAHTACGSVSEADGKVKVSGLRAGAYQLFANPVDGTPHTYGAQWVGFGRGTGRQLHAKSFVVGTGETLQGPVIRLDRAGTISGGCPHRTVPPCRGVMSGCSPPIRSAAAASACRSTRRAATPSTSSARTTGRCSSRAATRRRSGAAGSATGTWHSTSG